MTKDFNEKVSEPFVISVYGKLKITFTNQPRSKFRVFGKSLTDSLYHFSYYFPLLVFMLIFYLLYLTLLYL